MKRKILKLVTGERRDGTTWYGVVVESELTAKGQLLPEKMEFITKAIYDKLKEEAWEYISL
jgi:hypothetical protein